MDSSMSWTYCTLFNNSLGKNVKDHILSMLVNVQTGMKFYPDIHGSHVRMNPREVK